MSQPRPGGRSRRGFVFWSEGVAVGERESVDYFNSPWGSKFACGLLKLTEFFLLSVRGLTRVLCINYFFYCWTPLHRAIETHRDQDAYAVAHRKTHNHVRMRSHSHTRSHA